MRKSTGPVYLAKNDVVDKILVRKDLLELERFMSREHIAEDP
jgi:hypothetical protein